MARQILPDEVLAAFKLWADRRADELGIARRPVLAWEAALLDEYIEDLTALAAAARAVRQRWPGTRAHPCQATASSPLSQAGAAGVPPATATRSHIEADEGLRRRFGREYDWALCGWFSDAAKMTQALWFLQRATAQTAVAAEARHILHLLDQALRATASNRPSGTIPTSSAPAQGKIGYTAGAQEALAVTIARLPHAAPRSWALWFDIVGAVFRRTNSGTIEAVGYG